MTDVPSVGTDSPQGADLPSSWALTTLGTVTDYGKTVKVEPADIPADAWVLELEDIEKDSSRILRRLTQSERQSLSTKNRFDASDVLYGKLRPYLNKVVIADAPGFCTTEIVPVQAGPALEQRYLFHWLKHPAFLKYVEAASHGMNMPRLGTDAGRAAPLVLAPRPEQTRIADQLDTLLARIQACQDRLEAIPALLKRFRRASLDAAISGDLTADWTSPTRRGKSAVSLSEVCLKEKHSFGIGPFGSDLKVSDYRTVGVPLVFVREIRARTFGGQGTKFLSEEKAQQLVAHTVLPGDLLVTKMGDPPGDTAIYPDDRPPAVMTADVVRMRVNPQIAHARYVSYWLESSVGRRLIATITAGVAQRKVSLERLKTLEIDLPDTNEQAEVVRKVEALFTFIDRIEARYFAAITQAQRLTPLTLAKAFRGDLVPQDPNDEPAAALLARIAEQRATSAAEPRARQPRRARTPRAPKETAAMTKSRQDDDVTGQPYLAAHLHRIGTPASAEALFKVAELPVADFYKQLAWEVAQGHVNDNQTTLEPGRAAG